MNIKAPSKVRDSLGKEWTLKVTACSILKACRGTGLSIQSLMNADIEIEYILAALPFFCEDEVKEARLTHDEFMTRFEIKELLEVITEFFPAMGNAFPEPEAGTSEGTETDPLANPGPVTTS